MERIEGSEDIKEVESIGLERELQMEQWGRKKSQKRHPHSLFVQSSEWWRSHSLRQEIQGKKWRGDADFIWGGHFNVKILRDIQVEVYNKQLGVWS